MVLKKALFTPSEGAAIASVLTAESLPIPTVAVILNPQSADKGGAFGILDDFTGNLR